MTRVLFVVVARDTYASNENGRSCGGSFLANEEKKKKKREKNAQTDIRSNKAHET